MLRHIPMLSQTEILIGKIDESTERSRKVIDGKRKGKGGLETWGYLLGYLEHFDWAINGEFGVECAVIERLRL